MHSNGQNDLSTAFRTPRLVLPLQTMDGVITTRGSASRLRRDAGYAATHTQTYLCGAVQAGGASDSNFCVTRSRTHSILVYNSCYGMSEGTTRTEGPPCKGSKPRLSVRPRSGPCWAPWPPHAIRRAIGSYSCCR